MRLLSHLFLCPLFLVVTLLKMWERPERPFSLTWLLVVDYFDRHPALYGHLAYLQLGMYGVALLFIFG